LAVEAAAPLLLVDRRILSRFQLERAVAAGARHVPRRIREASPTAAGFRLVDDEGGSYDVGYVIGADGASSRMRRLLSPGLQPVQTPTRGRFVPIPRDAAPELVVRFRDRSEERRVGKQRRPRGERYQPRERIRDAAR